MTRLGKSFASFFVFGTSLYIILNACTDQRLTSTTVPTVDPTAINEGTNTQIAVPTFSSDVGAPIDQATGIRWMNNFANSNRGAVSEYTIPVSILKSILSSASCAGIVLYYAIDDSKKLHIIPIGVTNAGKVIAWRSITLENTIITWQTAWQWINNYSGSLRSHFFGSQILVSNYLQAKNLRLSRAVNDTGAPQLLLSDADISSLQGYLDESRPCPPYCATN